MFAGEVEAPVGVEVAVVDQGGSGPPGWVVVGIAGVITVGMAGVAAYTAYSRSRTDARPIPKPQATRYKMKLTYTVYEIHEAFGKKRTFKYGITSTLGTRPGSRLSACRAYFKSMCTWRTVRTVTSYFLARDKEWSISSSGTTGERMVDALR